MAKRLTDSEKWKDPWFRDLGRPYREFWVYLCDTCTFSGIWKKDFKMASFCIGEAIDEQEARRILNGRIVEIDQDKWFIPKFLIFQYETLNPNRRVCKSVIDHLSKILPRSVYLELVNPLIISGSLVNDCLIAKDKSKDKDKDKDSSKSLVVKDFKDSKDQKKELTPVQKVVLAYKVTSGHAIDDKAWDKMYFSRFSQSASQLLHFLGSWQDASDCIEDIYNKLTSKGLTVTLETINKHAAEWKKDKHEREGKRHGVLPGPSNGSMPFRVRTVGEITEPREKDREVSKSV